MKHSWSVYTAASGEQFCMSRDSCPWAGQKFNENPNIKKLDPDPKDLCISQITKSNNKNCIKNSTENFALHFPLSKNKKRRTINSKSITLLDVQASGRIFRDGEQLRMPGKQFLYAQGANVYAREANLYARRAFVYACGAILYAQEAI